MSETVNAETPDSLSSTTETGRRGSMRVAEAQTTAETLHARMPHLEDDGKEDLTGANMPTDQAVGEMGAAGDQIERGMWMALMEAVPACAMVLDPKGKELYMSRTADKTFRVDEDAPWNDKAILPDHVDALRHDGTPYSRSEYPIVRCLEKQEIIRGEGVRYRTPLGEQVCVRVTASPVFHESKDEVIAVTAIIEDITVQETKQSELTKLHADREANIRLNQLKDQFVGQISHELRTPLNGLIGLVELLGSTSRTDQAERELLLSQLKASSESFSTIINNLVTLQTISAGRPEPILTPTLVSSIVDAAISAQQRHAFEEDVQLIPRYEGDIALQKVMCDGPRLQIALEHILHNAVRFSEPRGTVTIETSALSAAELGHQDVIADPQQRYISVVVTDTGQGMDPETLERAFEPFYQQDSSAQRAHGGAGVGTTVARAMLLAHKGDVRILRSTPKQGAAVQLFFPVVEVKSHTTRLGPELRPIATRAISAPTTLPEFVSPPQSPTSLRQRALSSNKRRRILTVDDDKINLLVVCKALEREGFDVVRAVNGVEAVDAWTGAEQTFDACIMDIMMPVMDGLEAASLIRASGGEHLPMLAFTASSAVGTLSECHKLSMKVVQKPCSPRRLIAVVNDLLQRPVE